MTTIKQADYESLLSTRARQAREQVSTGTRKHVATPSTQACQERDFEDSYEHQ